MAIERPLPSGEFVIFCDEEGCDAAFESGVKPGRPGVMAAARAAGYAIRAAQAAGWTREFPRSRVDDRKAVKTAPAVDRCPACSPAEVVE